ncbi:hypothetical protein RB25_14675 [Herbaspirillum rubrisubalbicans]|uniref:Uncharacterized protein n=3 Tax=Herbaspirillum rubrisubalbicans TaxID=80842 RepID=A0ABX9BYE0_9BURK|nr:hypothetical protein C798_00305 [Herbaspirillum rubrisubalbicans Os34]RAM62934.1 hypothetical protein RB24_18400 [Herbaspirillum rubrisubalbicans]RAN46702.1 hypothetical protein RB25_14675 [Herbaspirillum rubrisubalbicans]
MMTGAKARSMHSHRISKLGSQIMSMEQTGDELASRRSRELMHQLHRLQEIMESLNSTFEELALHADMQPDDSPQSVAAAAIAKAMKT